VRVDDSLIRKRSTAYSFDIRRRSFCLLLATEGSTGRAVPLLVLRARPGERSVTFLLYRRPIRAVGKPRIRLNRTPQMLAAMPQPRYVLGGVPGAA
jgi:hypothetical protein